MQVSLRERYFNTIIQKSLPDLEPELALCIFYVKNVLAPEKHFKINRAIPKVDKSDYGFNRIPVLDYLRVGECAIHKDVPDFFHIGFIGDPDLYVETDSQGIVTPVDHFFVNELMIGNNDKDPVTGLYP